MTAGILAVAVLVLAGCVLVGVAWDRATARMDREAEAEYERQRQYRLNRELHRHGPT